MALSAYLACPANNEGLSGICRGRRVRCHGWYHAVTAVLLKAVYGKMVKARDVIQRML